MKKMLNAILAILLIFSTMVLFGDFEKTATVSDMLLHWTMWLGVVSVLACTLYFINPTEIN